MQDCCKRVCIISDKKNGSFRRVKQCIYLSNGGGDATEAPCMCRSTCASERACSCKLNARVSARLLAWVLPYSMLHSSERAVLLYDCMEVATQEKIDLTRPLVGKWGTKKESLPLWLHSNGSCRFVSLLPYEPELLQGKGCGKSTAVTAVCFMETVWS